jgi:anti-sigma B factor antagonist
VKIRQEHFDHILCLHVEGRLDAAVSDELNYHLNHIISQGQSAMIVECSSVNFLSSAGIRTFLNLLKRIEAAKGHVVFCGFSEQIMQVLSMAGFAHYFQHFASTQDALQYIQNHCS